MSVDTKAKKRKSGDSIVPATTKKAKTSTTPKSAERPAPLKSALKKSKSSTEKIVEATPPEDNVLKSNGASKTKKSSKIVAHDLASETVKAIEEKSSKVIGVDAEDEIDDTSTALSADQTAALLAGFSSDEDEDDEEGQEDIGIDIAALPTPPTSKVSKKTSSKLITASTNADSTPGTIYVSRLPHGFYERQLHAYLSQFGTIANLRLSRNPRTGKSRHHAFIQFASSAVAEIVAKTMDKYLLFGHILQVKMVPGEQVNEKMWKKGRKIGNNGRVAPRNRIEGGKLKRGMEREKWEKRVEREEARRKEKAEKLKGIGYEFEMPELKKVSDVPRKEKDQIATIEDSVGPAVEETITETVQTLPAGTDASVSKLTVEKTVKRKSKDGEVQSVRKTKKSKVTG